MSRLKRFIVEIHRRSLWQVMTIYLGASWAVLEASDQVIDRYLLPEWVYPTEILLLLIGLPLVLAIVRLQLPLIELRLARLEELRGNVDGAVRHYRNFLDLWAESDPELRGEVEAARRALARLAGREEG